MILPVLSCKYFRDDYASKEKRKEKKKEGTTLRKQGLSADVHRELLGKLKLEIRCNYQSSPLATGFPETKSN